MCGRQTGLPKPAPIPLCGQLLPYVPTASHLGHELHESGLMDHDARTKRAQYIGQSVEVRQTYSFASPAEVLRALDLYCSSYYGSMLWDLGTVAALQFFNTWAVNVKLAWNLPRGTHTYFLPFLAPESIPARVEVMARMVGFFRNLRKSPSHEVVTASLLAGRDLTTTLGMNLRLVEEESNLDPWVCSPSRVRTALLAAATKPVPEADRWRPPYLAKLLEHRQQLHYCGLDTQQQATQELIDTLCTN
jgi:hypothetical protein